MGGELTIASQTAEDSPGVPRSTPAPVDLFDVLFRCAQLRRDRSSARRRSQERLSPPEAGQKAKACEPDFPARMGPRAQSTWLGLLADRSLIFELNNVKFLEHFCGTRVGEPVRLIIQGITIVRLDVSPANPDREEHRHKISRLFGFRTEVKFALARQSPASCHPSRVFRVMTKTTLPSRDQQQATSRQTSKQKVRQDRQITYPLPAGGWGRRHMIPNPSRSTSRSLM